MTHAQYISHARDEAAFAAEFERRAGQERAAGNLGRADWLDAMAHDARMAEADYRAEAERSAL